MNARRFFKRAGIVVPVIVLIAFMVSDEERSIIGQLLDSLFSSRVGLVIGGVATFLVALGMVIWMILGLFDRKNKTQKPNAPRALIVLGLSSVLVLWPAQARATVAVPPGHQNAVTVYAYEDGSYHVASVEGREAKSLPPERIRDLVERELTKDRKKTSEPQVATVTLLEGIIILIIIIAVTAGLAYIGYKLYRAIRNIGQERDRKQKKLDEDEEKDNQGSSTGDDTAQVFAAVFPVGPASHTEGEYPYDGVEPFVLSFEVPSGKMMTGEDVPAYGRFPAVTVDLDAYLLKHGLSTNLLVESFSSNSIPVPVLPVSIRRVGTSVTAEIVGLTNNTYVFQRSTNLVVWETFGRLAAPVFPKKRNIVSVTDGLNPRDANVFYRIHIEQ